MIEIRHHSFDPWIEIADYRNQHDSLGSKAGACASFVGTMRDFNEDDTVISMELEHYPGMTERQLEQIVNDSCEGHDILSSLVLHRVGVITPGDDIVLVAVWSAHRRSAFIVCRAIMEALKSRAPFWKKETLVDGSRWVEKNTAG